MHSPAVLAAERLVLTTPVAAKACLGTPIMQAGTVHPVVASKRTQIETLCRALGVRRLDLVGSAVDDRFDAASSDVDVLVEFSRGPGFDYYDTYFALKDGLEEILGRPVDVVSVTGIRNPYLREQVMRTRELLYAA